MRGMQGPDRLIGKSYHSSMVYSTYIHTHIDAHTHAHIPTCTNALKCMVVNSHRHTCTHTLMHLYVFCEPQWTGRQVVSHTVCTVCIQAFTQQCMYTETTFDIRGSIIHNITLIPNGHSMPTKPHSTPFYAAFQKQTNAAISTDRAHYPVSSIM